MGRGSRVGVVAALLVALATLAGSRAGARTGPSRHVVAHATAVHHPDFNHDGYADLVVSAQGDTVGAATEAGGLWVLYGGAHGANAGNRHQYFTESSIG